MHTLTAALNQRLRQRANHCAVVWNGQEIRFAELESWSNAIAFELQAMGISAADRVAVGLSNSPVLVATVLAVIRSGAILVPLNPSGSADEARYIVDNSGAAVAVLGKSQESNWGEVGTPLYTPCRATVSATPVAQHNANDEDIALLVYTSGTTGRPKGVALSQAALVGNLKTVREAWKWTAEDRLLLTLPCFHLHGLALGIIGSILAGSSIVLRERFVADEVLGMIERWRCTLFFGVPTMYNRLVLSGEERQAAANLTSMRLWVSGSAPLTPATFSRFQDRFGHQILERFGMSEGGFMIAVPYEGPRRAGTIGRPLPGIEIRLIDPEKADLGQVADDVPRGTSGEIAIRGPNLFSGYWNDPDATQRAYVGPYFRSGDLAQIDPDGMIRIIGRLSVDIIKSRGFKISAIEIENCLQRHPDIAEVAVVGVPNDDLGQEVVAAVTPKSGNQIDIAAVTNFARQHLAGYKIPRRIVVMDSIPKTGPGKFKKTALIESLSE